MTGWGTYTPLDGCFQRVRFTGGATPVPVAFEARDNGVLLVESWTDAYYGHFTAASEGTRPLVVSYATSPPAEVIFADPRPSQAPTAAAALTCFRQYEFAGILRGSKHVEQARLLIDFLVSRRFQEDLPLTQFVWPANRTASVPKEFTDYALRPENPLTIDPATIADRATYDDLLHEQLAASVDDQGNGDRGALEQTIAGNDTWTVPS